MAEEGSGIACSLLWLFMIVICRLVKKGGHDTVLSHVEVSCAVEVCTKH